MGDLSNRRVKDIFANWLQIDSGNQGLAPFLRRVQDGRGNDTPLQVSSTAVQVDGNLTVTGTVTANFSGMVTSVNGLSGAVNLTAAGLGAAPASHTHSYAALTGVPATFPPSAHAHAWTEITAKPSTFPPDAHSHPTASAQAAGFLSAADKARLDGLVAASEQAIAGVASVNGETGAVTLTAAKIGAAPAAHTHLWADLTDKPATFAPSAHSHAYSSLTGVPATFAPSAHTHSYASLTGVPATFAPEAHSHAYGDLTGLPALFSGAWADLSGKPATFPPAAHTHAYGDLTGIPATFAPSAHNHALATTGADGFMSAADKLKLDGLSEGGGVAGVSSVNSMTGAVTLDAAAVGAAPASHSHAYSSLTGVPATFAPSAHNHAWTEITSKPTQFAPSPHTHLWAELTDKPTLFPPTAHTHSYGDLTDVPATFAPSAHTHAWTEITAKPTTFAPAAHNQAWSTITGTPTTLAGYGITDGGGSSYVHPTGDGNLHVPATGTTNNGKFLEAGATAGSLSWASIVWADITTGKPTTLTGYGITDAAPLAHVGTGGTAHANVVAAGAAGFMTGADKTKLDGIATGATAYTHPTGDGNLHVPATSTTNSGRVLTAGATAGSLSWATPTVTWANITGEPTTLAGYGITDAASSTHTHTFASLTTKPTTMAGYGITDGVTQASPGFTGNLVITNSAHILLGSATNNGGNYNSTVASTAASNHFAFYNPNGAVGVIQTSASATVYQTSSDYRLKQDVVDMDGGLDRLNRLRPVRFAFKVDPSERVDGFIAHEVQPHVPQAVTGTKDGDDMQGIDHSKLVPLLVAAVQELAAEVALLKGRMDA